MKATLEEASKPKSEITFPVLMRSLKSNAVVLFTAPEKGIYLFGESHPIGHETDSWMPVTNTETWERFTGSITLSN